MWTRRSHTALFAAGLSLTLGCNDTKDPLPGDTDTNAPIDSDVVDTDAAETDTTAPVITIVGGNPLFLGEGETFTDPGATAEDETDGTVEVTVTDDVDAARDGTYTVTYTATDAAGNTATATREVVVEFRGQLAITAVGPGIALVGIAADGTITERDRHTLDLAALHYNDNHVVFSITEHPTLENTVFVTSFNECSSWSIDNEGCWGNARIDRYTYDVHEVTHEGVAMLLQHPLRMHTGTYDDVTGTTSVQLLNQSREPIEMSTLTFDAPRDATASHTCAATILQPGDACTISVVDGAERVMNFSFDFTSSLGSGDGSVSADSLRVYPTGVEFDITPAGLPRCANEDGIRQVGSCAPTTMTFSADGTRAYVNDNDDNAFHVFSVDAIGDFTFIQGTGTPSYQGVATDASGTALYSGARVFRLDGDVATLVSNDNEGGNATEVVTDTSGKELLVSSIENDSLRIWDISNDPLDPVLISEALPGDGGQVRFQHHSDDLSTFVTVDLNILSTLSFDGTTLEVTDTLELPIEGLNTCPTTPGCWDGFYRGVQVSGDGSMAVASAFVNFYSQDAYAGAAARGLLTSFAIDATTNEVTLTSTHELDGSARAILFLDTP